MSESTAMIAVVPSNFAVARYDPAELVEIINDNMGGDAVSVNQLPRIKVPGSGGTIFTIPSTKGEEDMKEFDAIIIGHRMNKAYWTTEFSGEGVTPDCFSDDGKIGILTDVGKEKALGLGGPCDACPMNQFKSGKGGRGKACKDSRLVFVLGKNDILPKVLQVPATSLKSLRDYMLALSMEGKGYYHVITRFTLHKVKGQGTPDYAVIDCAVLSELPDAEKEGVKKISTLLKPILDAVRQDGV